MPSIFVTDREGSEAAVEARPGYSLMEILRERYPDEILALCGGSASCATCHVYVDPAFAAKLPAQSDIEDGLLDMTSHRLPTSRLSCQIPFEPGLDGLKLTIAPDEE